MTDYVAMQLGCLNHSQKCPSCPLHNNGCLLEMPYNVVKAVYPITTTAHEGVNVQQLVKEKYPTQYKALQLYSYDWANNLDGVLDFLYGERDLGLIASLYGIKIDCISEIIKLIESNCEVR